MKINNNKCSNKYEYSIFTHKAFKKPNKYILCYRNLPILSKWWHKFFSSYVFINTWSDLAEDGTTSYGYKKPYITESIEKINSFMDWNIEGDNSKASK